MKKRIRNLIGVVVMAAAIVFSAIQLNIPATMAQPTCPDDATAAAMLGCSYCSYSHSTTRPTGVTCFYMCMCGGSGGGGEHMEIEKEIEIDE